jgi:hypothetical protein
MHDAELQMNQYMPELAEFNKANDVSQRDSKVSGYKQNNYTVSTYVCSNVSHQKKLTFTLPGKPIYTFCVI